MAMTYRLTRDTHGMWWLYGPDAPTVAVFLMNAEEGRRYGLSETDNQIALAAYWNMWCRDEARHLSPHRCEHCGGGAAD